MNHHILLQLARALTIAAPALLFLIYGVLWLIGRVPKRKEAGQP